MPISVEVCELTEIASLRERYREAMRCQIVHDSIHVRPGWTTEYILRLDGIAVGYGSVAIGGPWTSSHTLYEFFVEADWRGRVFDLFAALLVKCGVAVVETQTNALILPIMLHTFGQNVRADAILFEDGFVSHLQPRDAEFRAVCKEDAGPLTRLELDDTAGWLVTFQGQIAAAGGVLYHYNRPYGDVYMKVAEPFRNKGLGSYLVQELKRVCREGGSVPAARCNVDNVASRRTLQKAGFVPCGNRISGVLVNL